MRRFLLLAAISILGVSCHRHFAPTSAQTASYKIEAKGPQDSLLAAMLRPYRDSLGKSMNEVLGTAAGSLEKEPPSGSLGFFMADAMSWGAEKTFGKKVDAAFVNYGGIRLTQLPAGSITREKIFELMPFDNLVLIQQLSGAQLQALLDHTASRGGWPVSGIEMRIRNKKAIDVRVGGQSIDPTKMYTVANSDYVINGGDDAVMLRDIANENRGYLFRDALIDYVRGFTAAGKVIAPTTEKRIQHVD